MSQESQDQNTQQQIVGSDLENSPSYEGVFMQKLPSGQEIDGSYEEFDSKVLEGDSAKKAKQQKVLQKVQTKLQPDHIQLKAMFLKQNVTRVMKPMMEMIAKMSTKAEHHSELLSNLKVEQDIHYSDISNLKKAIKTIDDIQRSQLQLDGDVKLMKCQADTVERQSQQTTEMVKSEILRINKQFAAVDDMLKQFRQRIMESDRCISDWKDQQLSSQLMHNEDISQRIAMLKESIKEAHIASAKVTEKNNIMIDKLDETYQSVIESTSLINDIDKTVAELARNKVDKAPFHQKVDFLNGQLYQMMRRLNNSEEETYRFGEFVLKYQPVLFQLTVAENLNEVLDGRGLSLAKSYQYKKLEEYKELLSKKIYPMNHISTQESEIRRRFHDITKSIDEQIEKYTQYAKMTEEQQKIKDKLTQKIILRHAEAATEKRIDEMEKRFQKMMGRQQEKTEKFLHQMEKKGKFKKSIKNSKDRSKTRGEESNSKEKSRSKDRSKHEQTQSGSDIGKAEGCIGDLKRSQKSSSKRRQGSSQKKDSHSKEGSIENVDVDQENSAQVQSKQYSNSENNEMSSRSSNSFNSQSDDSSDSEEIDMANYYTKEEVNQLLETVNSTIDFNRISTNSEFKVMRDAIDINEKNLEQAQKTVQSVNQFAKEIDKSVAERQQDLKDQLDLILKRQQREKSDLQNANMKLVNRIDRAEKKIQDMLDSVHSICTISICLLECACMQVRLEEQDDLDREGIALMGRSTGDSSGKYGATTSQMAINSFQNVGTHMTTSTNNQNNNIQDTKTLPQMINQAQMLRESSLNLPVQQPTADIQEESQQYNLGIQMFDSTGMQQYNSEVNGFPKSVDLVRKKSPLPNINGQSNKLNSNDDGLPITAEARQIHDDYPKPRGTLSIDPVCFSCSNVQSDIIKQFKIACLAYAPNPVVYRNILFSRTQMRTFRKFLLGQCSKIVHLKEPFTGFKMSQKKVFDDMYLYLMDIHKQHQESLKKQKDLKIGRGPKDNSKPKHTDSLNGLPTKSYEDVAARFWNLIYKDHYHQNIDDRGDAQPKQLVSKAQSLIITNIDKEFNETLADKFRFEFGSLQNIFNQPKHSLEKYQINQNNFLPFAGNQDFPKGSMLGSQRAFARSTLRPSANRLQQDSLNQNLLNKSSIFGGKRMSSQNQQPMPLNLIQLSNEQINIQNPPQTTKNQSLYRHHLQAFVGTDEPLLHQHPWQTLNLEPQLAKAYNHHLSVDISLQNATARHGPQISTADNEIFGDRSCTGTVRSRLSQEKDPSKFKINAERYSVQANLHRTIAALTPLNQLSGAIHGQDIAARDSMARVTVGPRNNQGNNLKIISSTRGASQSYRKQHNLPQNQHYQSINFQKQTVRKMQDGFETPLQPVPGSSTATSGQIKKVNVPNSKAVTPSSYVLINNDGNHTPQLTPKGVNSQANAIPTSTKQLNAKTKINNPQLPMSMTNDYFQAYPSTPLTAVTPIDNSGAVDQHRISKMPRINESSGKELSGPGSKEIIHTQRYN